MGIIGNTITLVTATFFLYITPISKLYQLIVHAALPYRMILLNSYLIFISILITFKVDASKLYQNPSYIFAVLTLLVAANICLLYYDAYVQQQQKEILSYKKNTAIYESLIGEIRSRQHEYSNRIQTLQTLPVTCKDYDSICLALKKYTEEYVKPVHAYPLLCIDMPLLSAGLYHLASKAEQAEITVQFDVVTNHLESHALEYQLSDFACILLQNAIEACHSKDVIYVHISSENKQTHIEIRNPSPNFILAQDIRKFFKKGFTTKKVQSKDLPHGYGLYTLLRQIHKLGGTIEAECAENLDGTYWIIFRIEV